MAHRGAQRRARRVRVRGLGGREPVGVRQDGRPPPELRREARPRHRRDARRARRARRRGVRRPVRQPPRDLLRPDRRRGAVRAAARRFGLRHRRRRPRARALRRAVVHGSPRLLHPHDGPEGHRPVRVGTQRRGVHAHDAASPQPRLHRPPAARRAGPQPLHDREPHSRRRRACVRPGHGHRREHRQLARSAHQRPDVLVLRRVAVGLQRRARVEGHDDRRGQLDRPHLHGRGEMWGHRGTFMENLESTKVD